LNAAASPFELARSRFLEMRRRCDDMPGASHKIHSAAHPWNHFAGNLVVGQVAFLIDFEHAENRIIDMLRLE